MIVFVSWTPHHRASDIAERVHGDYVVPAAWALRMPAPLRYLVQAVATIGLIVRKRPTVVLCTNPPFVATAVCLIAARRAGCRVWSDCHSGVFNDPRWSRFSLQNGWILRRCRGVIFHNRPQVRTYGGLASRALVISTDGMQERPLERVSHRLAAGPVVVPASYAFDEPIQEICAAARLLPERDFVLTGRAPDDVRRAAGPNVRFCGWIDAGEYQSLLASASVVLCLTSRENTMQGGLLEALEHARPAMTSATAALAEWCRDIEGVKLIDTHEPATIARALEEIFAAHETWSQAALRGRTAALRRAAAEMDELRGALNERR